MSASWTGSLVVDDISIPLKLHPIVREDGVKLSYRCAEHNSKVTQAWICEKEGHVLLSSQLGRGFFDGKNLLPVSKHDLKKIEPEPSKALTVLEVRPREDFPFYMVRGSYATEADQGFSVALESFLEALWDMKAIAICTFSMRGKENLCALNVDGRLLMMHWPKEINQQLYTGEEVDRLETEKFHRILARITKTSTDPIVGQDPYVESLTAIVSDKVMTKMTRGLKKLIKNATA